jgi:hypothetical protein
MYWKHVHHLDERARALADRHYSRQHVGAREFCPPGNKIVLLGLNDDALWVSHRPDPNAGLLQRRADGFDYWDNPYFRNESNGIASEMILEALAITLYVWGRELPPDGFQTFVDARKVRPTIRHSRPVYGWCFLKAGFELYPEHTKERDLLRLIYPSARLRLLQAMRPLSEQMSLFV